MILRQGYTFRLKADRKIEAALRRSGGCCRFVWNKALAIQKERLGRGESVQSYAAMCAELATWKSSNETAFLGETHSQTLQQKLKDLRRAFDDFFDPTQPEKLFPRFKKKSDAADSLRYPQGVKLDGRRVYLPKIGWVRFYQSREIEGVIKNVTVRQRGAQWFVSIQTEREVPDPIHPSASIVGLDLGVVRLLTSTDGTIGQPVRAYRDAEAELGREQQKLARQETGSSNWKEQQRRIRRLHRRIADIRQDALHKITTTISKTHATVVCEDLRVKAMTASARGTSEAPGRNVRQKSGLNKAILDQGWGELMRQLDYKLHWWGGELIRVPAGYTSQRCGACGHIAAENRPSQATFRCVECGHEANADVNAAENIKRAGQARMACESSPARGRKQEPVGTREEVRPMVRI